MPPSAPPTEAPRAISDRGASTSPGKSFLLEMTRFLGRGLLRLRYKITVHGAEKLKNLPGPVLVLPSHPSSLDGIMVLAEIGRYLPLRPVANEAFYSDPLLWPFTKIVKPIAVQELIRQRKDAPELMERMFTEICAGLARGENFLFYPAGRTQQRGVEVIGAAQGASVVLTRCPKTIVVLVRTRGMWGSMASDAQMGRPRTSSAELTPRMVKYLLSSLIFFLPRRHVRMEIDVADLNSLPDFSRQNLNPFLERWYNEGVSPEPVFVPYHHFLGPRTMTFPPVQSPAEVPLAQITPETRAKVASLLEEKLKRPLTAAEREPEYALERLGFDSLERSTLALEMEQRFGFHRELVPTNMGELWAMAQGVATVTSIPPPPVPAGWARPTGAGGDKPLSFPGDTLLEALVSQALAHWKDVAVVDDISGAVTYEHFILRARLLADFLSQEDDAAVGLMLPASAAADIVYFAVLFAGKIPVILNWTTGRAGLRHACETMRLKRVMTSRRFVDRSGVQLEGAACIYLEDVAKTFRKTRVLRELLALRWSKNSLLDRLPKMDPDADATILFTSGSETMPKAVRFSHRNGLVAIRGAASALRLKQGDTMLGFLPPFHSLGIGGTSLLPILGGIPVVHHPDPTDAAGLLRKIVAYKPSLVFTAPSFLRPILGLCRGQELDSLRLIATGAEKCPEAVFEECRVRAPRAILVEGYGITECSATISVNRPDRTKRGTVGQPLDGVEIRVVDAETKTPLPAGETGLLLVHGPTVTAGYVGFDGANSFHEMEGKRWYNSGDLAQVDAEGFIIFCGRLKRFIKYGAEMISLPALEEPLANAYPAQKEGPQVAVEGIETTSGGKRVVLFATTSISLEQANRILNEAGFSGMMRMDEVRQMEKIPTLGSGKTDYKALRAVLQIGHSISGL